MSRAQWIEASGSGVRKNLLVASHQTRRCFDRLSDQQSIERIAMQIGQLLKAQRVGDLHWHLYESIGCNCGLQLPEVDFDPTELKLDRKLPKGRRTHRDFVLQRSDRRPHGL